MVQTISRQEDIGVALRGMIVADLAESATILTDVSLPRAERIHKVRRRLKRARSTLAVLKPVLGDTYRRHRRAISAIARSLAARRDADVVAATARALSREVDGGERILVDVALADPVAAAQEALAGPIELATLSERLRRVAAEARALPTPPGASALLADALRRAYRRGRKAMRHAQEDGAAEKLHEWRKTTKDLWHLIRISRKRLPKGAGDLARGFDRLAETLGAERDAALVDNKAEALVAKRESEDAFREAIRRRREKLRDRAFTLGRKLYRQSPKHFAADHPLD